ncbi:MAG: hypothetical protein QOI54_3237 [Actinomycetota bacterium]|jgi:uncharacterized RmlC-like cupin family protein|nr:hypothetical protein [Actinomycetota bacterium]
MSSGIRVVTADERSKNTPQTPGLLREVAFDSHSVVDGQLNAFLSTVEPAASTGAHHHGEQDTVLYVLSGTAAYAWGPDLENVVWAGEGDFVYIPGGVVHQEINPSPDLVTRWVVVRSGADPVVVNLEHLDGAAERRAAQIIGQAGPA